MDISVIIPIYNVEKYIKKSLESIFNQTKVENVEFILVNDCTPDSSIKIAEDTAKKYNKLNIKIIN